MEHPQSPGTEDGQVRSERSSARIAIRHRPRVESRIEELSAHCYARYRGYEVKKGKLRYQKYRGRSIGTKVTVKGDRKLRETAYERMTGGA